MTPAGLLYNNPMAVAAIDRMIAAVDLGGDDVALDVGCGAGEVLARVLERHPCRGIGVDRDPDEIAAADRRLTRVRDRVALHATDAREFDPGSANVRLAICIGATHVYGDPGLAYRRTLETLAKTLTNGGCLLVGEGYWRRPPDPAYLASTGMGANDFLTHPANVTLAETLDLRPLAVAAASEADWDHFESCFWRAAEQTLRDTPNDDTARERAEHWRRWRRAYLQWGRETLGFGLYLLQAG
ncbi:MAG: class I SAM-dependent methyltransferase [Phycisphaerales bacterium]|nr:class I SAM-dependent methyltransferase [Phycisphaerae bacterium]NNM26898.1 class I SAM-dependent methyltransferase [Phycisphaerales bacterium]